ncbi:acid protease [Mycena maculata]|uniref:Acid protease n=1 Tax=Mycena maculata TaxID=230809 RepID=A0AAD7J6M5_9AGAR|nr:acid protease [Mycena maculata]
MRLHEVVGLPFDTVIPLSICSLPMTPVMVMIACGESTGLCCGREAYIRRQPDPRHHLFHSPYTFNQIHFTFMPHFIIKALPFKTRIAHGAKNILVADQARARKFLQGIHPHGPAVFHQKSKAHHHHHHHRKPHHAGGAEDTTGGVDASTSSIDVTDSAVTYTMSVGVGSPATDYTLLIDTGSSNTWVGADKAYTPTSTSTDTRNTVNVSYGSGSFSGTEYTDEVTLGTGLVIQNQSIGVASTATGFSGVDGIIGIGPVDLTTSTVSNTTTVPTVTDNLFTQGTIPVESIAISYVPSTSASAVNGELTFGGTDSTKFTGDITYVPITTTSPASQYWGIDQTVTYGTDNTILSLTAGIVDTGTTLLMLATDAFQAYQDATGATTDSTTGLLTVTEEQFNNMESLFFQIGDQTLELTPNAQIWPRSLNSTLGGKAGQIYLITADLGSDSGSGLDFIDGFGFLQRFYAVFDSTNSQIGFATTEFTDATTN